MKDSVLISIKDKDFESQFDGTKWPVVWKWRGSPPVPTNAVSKYHMAEEVEQQFDMEVERWKTQGWLRPVKLPAHGIIPWLAAEQAKKENVRPVMDYRELNAYIESYTGDSPSGSVSSASDSYSVDPWIEARLVRTLALPLTPLFCLYILIKTISGANLVASELQPWISSLILAVKWTSSAEYPMLKFSSAIFSPRRHSRDH